MTQLNAIIGSCLKWWRIRYTGGKDEGASNCPLCEKYDSRCFDCPIIGDCSDTPYQKWCVETEIQGYDAMANNKKEKQLASAELQFLFDLIKPRYYPNVHKELAKGEYPKKFRTWMERAITRANK